MLCQVEQHDGVLTCRRCGVPFGKDGAYAITAEELAAIGGRLDRIYRPCPPTDFRFSIADFGKRAPRPAPQNPKSKIQNRSAAACLHRGQFVRTERCQTCQGNVEMKIFACDQFGICSLSDRLPGVPHCSDRCERFTIKEAEAMVPASTGGHTTPAG